MIQNTSFQKKVVYLGLIALLMIPLYMIGHPATGDPTSLNASPGGQLAQLRTEYDLAPSELGEVDPASESMKLATLGMRGVAANILWTKANYYKKTEDWEKLVASVNQMAKLQPNFVSVWEFQSHNLSYNISVEHDDYRFRYLWVKKGIEFLLKGTRYNRKEPKLPWTVGWYTGQKFGRADEHRQFRVLFPEDQDFHNTLNADGQIDMDYARGGRANKPDNWLTSRLWYNAAYTIVETGDAPIRGKAPHIFYTDGPKALMNYASAIESEGILGDIAEYAWKQAGDAWDSYGQRVVPHSTGIRFRLGDQDETRREAVRLAEELHNLVPGLREQILQEKKAALTPEELASLDKTYAELTRPSDQRNRMQAEKKTQITYQEIAERAPSDVKAAAFRLAKATVEKEIETNKIAQYRSNVNYEYWQARCGIEQLPETVAAREDVFRAKEEMKQANLAEARKLFEAAWQKWAGIFQEHTVLANQLTEDDLVEDIQEYVRLLGQLDEELPDDFVLQDLLDKFLEPAVPLPGEQAPDPAKTTEGQAKLEGEAPEKPAEPAAEKEAPAEAEKPSESEPAAEKKTPVEAEKSAESESDSTEPTAEPTAEAADKTPPAKDTDAEDASPATDKKADSE